MAFLENSFPNALLRREMGQIKSVHAFRSQIDQHIQENIAKDRFTSTVRQFENELGPGPLGLELRGSC